MPELDGHDWVDCALFLMFAHAHMTDWELSEEELEVIEKKTETFVSHITGEGEIFTELDVKDKMRFSKYLEWIEIHLRLCTFNHNSNVYSSLTYHFFL